MPNNIATLETARAELDQVRIGLEIEQAKAEIARLSREAHCDTLLANYQPPNLSRESYNPWATDPDNYVDPRTPYLDAGYGRMGGDMPSMPEDTKDGRFRPVFDTMEELRIIQGTSRYLATCNEMGVSLLDGLTDYAVHTGFSYAAEAVRGVSVAEGLLRAVDAIIAEFQRRTNWRCLSEGEFFAESVIGGEQLAHVFPIGAGMASVEFVPSAQLSEPRSESQLLIANYEGLPALNWSFGVGSRIGDQTNEAVAYFVNRDNTNRNWKVIPASAAILLKRNVPKIVKRGLTDYYPLFRILKKCSPLLFNMIVGGAMRASIGYMFKPSNPTGGMVPLGSTTTRTAGSSPIDIDLHNPGQIKTLNNVDLLAGPLGNANEAGLVEILQAGYRIIGRRWGMPEYMSTADASSINRATGDVAESSFVRGMERRQAPYSLAFREIHWKVLAIAAEYGLLRQFGVESRADLEAQIELKVQPPEVEKRDKGAETTHNEALVRQKVMSRQTWQEKEGLDPDIERERIKEEDAIYGPPVTGTAIGGMPSPFVSPTLPTAPMQQPATTPEPAPQPAAPSTIANDPDLRLNGAQITAAIDVLKSVTLKALPDAAAIELLVSLSIDRNKAGQMVRAAAQLPPQNATTTTKTTEQQKMELARDLLFAEYP